MEFYHSSPVPLRAGSVIEPGNWGRIVRRYMATDGKVPINGLNEVALEFARLAYAPTKPSRLDCIFGTESMAAATAYRNQHHTAGIIYRVETLEEPEQQQFHIGNFEMAIRPHAGLFVPAMLERFRMYWTENHAQDRELLLSSPVRILERLD